MEEKQESSKVKKPIYKKWWFWVVIILVIAVVIGVVSGSSGGNDKGEGKDKTPNNTRAYIGDTVTSSSVKFTVTQVDNVKRLGGEYLGYDTDYNFIIINLNIENDSNSEVSIYDDYFELKKGDTKYELHSGTAYVENGFWLIQTVGAKMKKNVVLAFEVPDKTTDSEYFLNVKGGSFSTKKSIVLKQK